MPKRAPSLTRHLEAIGPIDPDAMPLKEARAELERFYVGEHDYSSRPSLLTPPENQPKLKKSKVRPAYGLTLAPADMSGWEACMWRTEQCTAVCVLATGGRSGMAPIKAARVLKTRALAEHPQAFVTVLAAEIDAAARKAERAGFAGIDVRLNVASDLRWERFAPALLNRPGTRSYDYTKAPAGQRGEGYASLTFSVSEHDRSVAEALEWLERGGNAAVVFERPSKGAWDGLLPETWNGFTVVDGDLSDSRVDDAPATVIGLRAKGAAVGQPAGGFVHSGEAS